MILSLCLACLYIFTSSGGIPNGTLFFVTFILKEDRSYSEGFSIGFIFIVPLSYAKIPGYGNKLSFDEVGTSIIFPLSPKYDFLAL